MHPLIEHRKTIRFFTEQPIEEPVLQDILRAGMRAPSPKNRQHWKLIVVSGDARMEMKRRMEEGIERSFRGEGIIQGSRAYMENAIFTKECMAHAPVTVFVVNPEGKSLREPWTAAEKIHELSDVQAIGALAENMALEAEAAGIGSLWSGNIFFAYDELQEWLGQGEMVLAMSFGYPASVPMKTRRKDESECIEYRK
jgi:nitroreductase